MMLRNSSTGAFELYNIKNNSLTGAFAIGTVGLDWQIAGFGPINGVGTSDMVLRNSGNGSFEVYDISNNQLTAASSLGQVGLDWQVGGIAADPATLPSGASTAQLVQAMAALGGNRAVSTATSPPDSSESSQQALLATPQHT